MSLSVRVLSDAVRAELNKSGYDLKSSQREYKINENNIPEFIKLVSTLSFKTRVSISMTIKEDDLVMKTDVPYAKQNACPCCRREYQSE